MSSDSDEEVDFNQFVDRIFYNEPTEPSSVTIHYNKNNPDELFSKLMKIFESGLQIIGSGSSSHQIPDILYELTGSDIEKLKKYFLSMGFKLNFKITHHYLVEKIRSFILNNKNYKFTEEDLQNYKKIFPSKIEVSDLIDNRTIQTKNIKDKNKYFMCKDLYFFINFEHV